MDQFVNIAKKMILIKDMSEEIDFDLIDKTFAEMEFMPNRANNISTDLHMFDRPGFEKIKETMIQESVNYLINAHGFTLGSDFNGLKITNSWANATAPGQCHHEHTHPFSIVSGVLFLDDNPDNLNLTLEAYLPEIPHYIPRKSNHVILKAMLPEDTTLSKHLVLFLSNIGHHVEPTGDDAKIRRTLSFNTFWTGRVGDSESELGSIVI